jgi:hypothetical protein
MFSSDKKDDQNPSSPGRRVLLIAGGLGAAGLVLSYFHKSAPVHVEAAAKTPRLLREL